MAFQAAAVLAVYRLSVRQAVTFPELGHLRMAPLMTIGAVDAFVQGAGCGQVICLGHVAGAAETFRDMAGRNDFVGLVRRVTAGTIPLSLDWQVPLVRFQAAGDQLVPGMAVVTEQLGVHLLADRGVARQAFLTCRFERITQGEQGAVRVTVAVQAVTDAVMGLAAMTTGAAADGWPLPRGMLRVAVEAGQGAGPGRQWHTLFWSPISGRGFGQSTKFSLGI